MVDDVKDITETAESKAATEALDRARLARERREAEQRKRLDELRAHAAAAQAQREKRDEERRRRQAEQRARDEDRRVQVEERKRAIWEASVSRRESLLQREKDRSERLERARASRSSPRPAFAFGSSTPRLLEPVDSGGFFWAARRAASTTNVMYASAPLTRRASALHLDSADDNNKDEADRPQPLMWSSVARRRTDLVPTIPAPRLQGRAYSMTRLDRIPSRPLHGAESVQHLNRQPRSGETTPGSRPGSALSSHTLVVRRPNSAPRRPRPASIAGTGMNTPRGCGAESVGGSAVATPVVSRDGSVTCDASRRVHVASTPRRPRPVSMHATTKPSPALTPGEGKPPLHRKPKLSKDQEKSGRVKSVSASPRASAERNHDQHKHDNNPSTPHIDKSQVSAIEVTQKLEALQIQNGHDNVQLDNKVVENKENVEPVVESKPMEVSQPIEKPVELKPVEKREERKESQDKTDENEMTASMTASMRRITTEEEAKAALAERRRRAREELEKQAEIERLRLQREAEEEAERQRQEEERQRREEQEARELAQLQRQVEDEKLRKAIEAQQQLERDEAERKTREEAERVARLKEEEEKKKAAEEAERVRREEAEREERERVLRKQRVEEIMMRTRLRKAEEDKKQLESKASVGSQPAPSAPLADNGNVTGDLLGLNTSQPEEAKSTQQATLNSTANEPKSESNSTNNGNTVDLLGLSEQNNTEDKKEITTNNTQNTNSSETNNGNHPSSNIGHISANFIQTERLVESQSKMAEQSKMADVKLIEDDFTTHNGHNAAHNHPLTLQNAI